MPSLAKCPVSQARRPPQNSHLASYSRCILGDERRRAALPRHASEQYRASARMVVFSGLPQNPHLRCLATMAV
jgi:hypothetical protein